MTSKIGSIGEFMQWTKRVVADPAAAADAPRQWFENTAAAEAATVKKARGASASASPEAMVKLLSGGNLALLQFIAARRPSSMRELADLTGRKESNLSRTLKKLQEAGIVTLEAGAGRTRVPRLAAQRVTLDLDLAGAGSQVAVEALAR